MNLYASYDDKDTIIHRLQTHISILEQQQQQHSNGYFSYEETPSINEHYSIDKNPNEDFVALEKLLQKREYELDQLREQLKEFQQEADEKLHRTIEQSNDAEKQLSIVECERNDLRQQLQHLQDENDLIKSYMNRLPSEIEYQKLKQSHQILEDQLKQSSQTVIESRKEKNHLKKQLITYERTINEQQQKIQLHESSSDKTLLNAKCLTMDERVETEKKFKQFNQTIQQLNEKLNEEKLLRKHDQYLNETNTRTLQSLSNEIAKKEQTIKETTHLLRQNRQELDELRIRFLVSEQEQICLNERLLANDQFNMALQRVHATVEKLFLVLDFSFEMLNNESVSSPDVLMLQLSTHKPKSDSINSSINNIKKIELCDVENLESKLDHIIDRLLSIRSELIARQFENDLESNVPCRLQ
ncbi:unnamed protein product [Rotaria socialis]|uniref:Uncharacterized protein n=1 Tax=Rotaria socialis TaxID=392032 RepID=A0A818IQV8_9BILA|nr:unnamed protein product [Rotaria socialis]CAF4587518.1 unnamed protein product [Rotaria socialis]